MEEEKSVNVTDEPQEKSINISDVSDDSQEKIAPFDRMMFGPRATRVQPAPKHQKQKHEEILEQIDLEELMTHVDTLLNSYHQVKPMFKKLGPLIEQFVQKK
ncbi:hypothetical protein [Mesobacillus harenae]|uniref:hypothetical protein n=1 Tax=Mesobacillus harenae TaxID=2213203 RepID=UPI0015805826|nr:hypothetical protein [Mesobacillus harenae]